MVYPIILDPTVCDPQLIGVDEQRLLLQQMARLILSGMYPFKKKDGSGWGYLITGKGIYVGTSRKKAFEHFWTKPIYYLGEGQMTDEEVAEIRKLDYLLDEDYKKWFEDWKSKFSIPIIRNVNYGTCEHRLSTNDTPYFVNWLEDGVNEYQYFQSIPERWQHYERIKKMETKL